MKKILLLFCISHFAFGQVDTTEVKYEIEIVEKFEKTNLIDEYEKAFGSNRPVHTGLRWRMLKNYQYSLSMGFQFEKKLTRAISIIPNIVIVNDQFNLKGLSLGIEGRYYYEMKKRISEGKQQPNLNGNFIGIKANRMIYPKHIISGFLNEDNTNFGIIWGKQFSNFFEFGILVGLKKEIKFSNNGAIFDQSSYNFYLATKGQVGLGFLFPKFEKKADYCDFLTCNVASTHMFKFNINDLIFLSKNFKDSKLDISYERKILNSSFSINSNLLINYIYYNFPYSFNKYDSLGNIIGSPNKFLLTKNNSFSVGINEQIRYYSSMRNRINRGLSANNLNGFYYGLEIRKYFSNQFRFLGYENYSKYNSSILGILIGSQYKTNLNSFIDVNLLMGISDSKIYINESIPKNLNIENRDLHNKILVKLSANFGFAR